MTPELLQLITRLRDSGEVGTLCLGKGARLRRVFFSGNEGHLLEAGNAGRFLPLPALFESEHITRATLDDMARRLQADQGNMVRLIDERGLLPDPELAVIAQQELLAEFLMVVARHGEGFVFERGSVPEELLLAEGEAPPGLPLPLMLDAMNQRQHELRSFQRGFPSLEEVPVLAELGLREQAQANDWVFNQVAELIDGFRNVRSIVSDAVLYPHVASMTLLRALQRSLIKKTTFPELRELDPERLNPREAARWADHLSEALPVAVDDMPLRELLAAVSLRAGDVELAIEQYNTMGDVWEHRGEFPRALEYYQESHRWDPESLILQEKIVRVYIRFAEDAFRGEQYEEGRRYLEEALRLNSSDLELYVRILDSYADPEQAIQHALPRLLKIMMRAGHADLATSLFEELVRRAPHHDNLRKRFVNFLLDHGANLRALEELEQLGNNLMVRGAAEEAQAIFDKIAMLAPGKGAPKLVPVVPKKPAEHASETSRPRVGFLGLCMSLALIVFGGYQTYALFALLDLNQKVDALVSHEVPAPGSPAHDRYAKQADDMLSEFRSFRRRHFASLWGGSAARLQGVVEGRRQFLDNQLGRLLGALLARGEQCELRGRLDEARRAYEGVREQAGDSLWKARADKHLKELETYLAGAEELGRQRELAIEARDYERAFNVSQELLFSFPRTTIAKNVLFPIQIESDPPGARVRSGTKVLGSTPLVLQLPPFETTALWVEIEGRQPYPLILENPQQSVQRVLLQPIGLIED